jgi:hypothetical protein
MVTGSGYKTFWYMELYLLVRLAQCVGLLINDLLTLLVLPRTPANHAIFLFPAILTPTKQTFFLLQSIWSTSPQRSDRRFGVHNVLSPPHTAHTAHTAHAHTQLIRVR